MHFYRLRQAGRRSSVVGLRDREPGGGNRSDGKKGTDPPC